MRIQDDLAVVHQAAFDRIVVELAAALNVDSDALRGSGHLIINGVDIGLLDYGLHDPGRMTLFFDLGAIPASREAAVCRQLLETNLLLPSSFGTFAIIPDNGHAAIVYRFDTLDGVDGITLAQAIFDVLEKHAGIENALCKTHRKRIEDIQRQLLMGRSGEES
ncbi:hypothetical protein J2W35_004194 [Variovorax boronicumulans]|uniref:CesT family type III secretion system chaperone n=1 Tax=Variovorax boronicumulans TaxID=436515 RepID=UPI00277EDC1E|nr:CesT family type III secretion system chaperone [Variovorax boronicumulans]MDQ0083828.1 hypothetical protein [Variovorax boronicumulans]